MSTSPKYKTHGRHLRIAAPEMAPEHRRRQLSKHTIAPFMLLHCHSCSDSCRTSKLTSTRLTSVDRSFSNCIAKQHPKRNHEHQQMSASINEKYETLNASPQMRSQNKQTIKGTNSATKHLQDDPTQNKAHLNWTCGLPR
jgi:hypothetical protein